MRVGVWNAERDRDGRRVARIVARLFSLGLVDVLALTEAQQYLDELRQLDGVQLVARHSRPGEAGTALLVRDGIAVSGRRWPRMTRRGWVTVRGGRTPAKYGTEAVVAGWLTVLVVHFPPSVRFWRRLPVGPVRRVAAYVAHARAVVRWLRRRPAMRNAGVQLAGVSGKRGSDHALVTYVVDLERRAGRLALVLGDFNGTPAERGRYGPRWIARAGRAALLMPRTPTHGRRIIDGAMAR